MRFGADRRRESRSRTIACISAASGWRNAFAARPGRPGHNEWRPSSRRAGRADCYLVAAMVIVPGVMHSKVSVRRLSIACPNGARSREDRVARR